MNDTLFLENALHILNGPPIPKVILHEDLLIISISNKNLLKSGFPQVNISFVKSISSAVQNAA